MLKFNALLIPVLVMCSFALIGQNITVDGYIFQSGNRGFLDLAKVEIKSTDGAVLANGFSDVTGHFVISVPQKEAYTLLVTKHMFEDVEMILDSDGVEAEGKLFTKVEMKRSPGYMFEITLAESREHDSIPVDAIKGARIEVYNNTTGETILELIDHPHPNFEVALEKGNHYTILVRKDGYLGKRMEAFVDVEGCILCFEGIGSVGPGVADNLSEGNQMGVLLANVALEKIYEGKTIPISNILYAYGSAEFGPQTEKGLLSLATIMKDNPDLTVEIGSHTDSRGKEVRNMELSRLRAKNVVNFLVEHGVDRLRLVSKGYGESKLLNDCNSFTECTERQHLKNRRTELKVLGVAPIKSPIKTLARIKQMEEAEKLMEEIQFSGQIQIPDTTNVVKIIEEQAIPVDESTGLAAIVEEEVPGGTLAEQDKEVVEEEVVVAVEEELVVEEVSHDEEPMKVVAEMPQSYSIIIAEFSEALPEDHELYAQHSHLNAIKQDGVHYYLIGHFDQMMDAEKFLRTVKMAYPDAEMAKLGEGKIIK